MSASELSLWTIYDSPLDAVGHFVTRRWVIGPHGATTAREAVLSLTLAEARSFVPEGLIAMGPGPEDDPSVVETWL